MMHPDHTDYDSRRLAVERARAAAMAMASVKRPYRAKGLDDQGRHPEALHDIAPAPAEAATDVGADQNARMPRVRPWTAGHIALLAYGGTVLLILVCFLGWLLKAALIALGVRT